MLRVEIEKMILKTILLLKCAKKCSPKITKIVEDAS